MRAFWPKREEVAGGCRKLHNYELCTSNLFSSSNIRSYYGFIIMEDEIGATYSSHGGKNEKWLHNFSPKFWVEVSTWEKNGSIWEDNIKIVYLDETEALGTTASNKPAVPAPDDWWLWRNGRMRIGGGTPKCSQRNCPCVKYGENKTCGNIPPSEILREGTMRITVFWHMTPCSLVAECHQNFGGTWWQPWRKRQQIPPKC
jgi:hypothetical protein